MSGPARVTQVLETSLYVDDLARAEAFYVRLFGFPAFLRDERMCALGTPGAAVLLLFRRGATDQPASTAGGFIPPHHGEGPQHLCFAIPGDALAAWEERFAAEGIAVESRVDWSGRATSLYFRDPDGHSLELATPRLWPNSPSE